MSYGRVGLAAAVSVRCLKLVWQLIGNSLQLYSSGSKLAWADEMTAGLVIKGISADRCNTKAIKAVNVVFPCRSLRMQQLMSSTAG